MRTSQTKSKHDGRFDLKFGPYHSPRARRGQRLFCENLGTVKVCKFSDGPISWPLCTVGQRGGPAFILCGDLVKAVRNEAAEAVARAWGVHSATVSRWRQILGVERFNRGTHELFLKYQGKGLTAEATARGRAMQTPDKQIKWGRQRSKEGRTGKWHWTPYADSLLGTMSDHELADRVGCSARTVALRRRELNVPPFIKNPLVAAGIRGSRKAQLNFSSEKLLARRLKLGLFQTQVSAKCGWKTPAMYQRLESGLQHWATPKVLNRVAAALSCSVEELLRRA